MATWPLNLVFVGVRNFVGRLMSRTRHIAGHSPPRIAILVFAAAVLVFTGLLMLPARCHQSCVCEAEHRIGRSG